MMPAFWIILLLSIFSCPLGSGTERVIPVSPSDRFTTDNLENVYVVKAATLLKYPRSLDAPLSFSHFSIREISQVDVSNPLKILVFDASLQKILFLDKTLSPLSEGVSLAEKGYFKALLACSSRNEGFWIYDENGEQLIQFDRNAQPILESGNIAQLTGYQIEPIYMIQGNTYLLLGCKTGKIFVFDVFGTYVKVISVPFADSFQVFGQHLIYYAEGSLYTRDIISSEEKKINIPRENTIFVRLEQSKMFLRFDNEIQVINI